MFLLRLIKSFWWRANSTGLRYKIMGIVIFLLLFLGGGITLQAATNLKRSLIFELEKRAFSIAADLSEDLSGLLVTGRLSALYAKVENAANNNTDISYILILDKEGRTVFQHPRWSNPLEMESFPPAILYGEGVHRARKSGIVNVALPITGELGGKVIVGMSEERINREVWIYTRRMSIFAALFSLLGLLASLYLTNVLTKPVKELVNVTHNVARGNLSARARIRSDDEIGKLGKAFNSMVADLEKWKDERQSLWDELKIREEMKGQLLQKVIVAQEDERKRIARELHDETSQIMASLMVGLKMLEQDGDERGRKTRIKELREMASVTMERVRRLAMELRPSSLDDLGLISAVEQYTQDFEKRFDIRADFQAIGFNGKRLALEKETVLYRIVQEALTNVAKHSRASTVGIVLEYRSDMVKAIIEDDGCGFEVEKVIKSRGDDRGLGIHGMLERAAIIGGKLSIESSPGKGTALFVEIPA